MAIFKENCPYCGTKKVAFSIISEHFVGKYSRGYQWDALSICGQCNQGVIARFTTPDTDSPTARVNQYGIPISNVERILPSAPKNRAPKYTPENVARFYKQGMENLSMNWDASGAMFRKTLDTGLKNKFPDLKGNLVSRINKAESEGELTPALAEWAHKIRLDGNEAAHDEEPFTKNDAEVLQVFTDLVLQYLFTLPGMLKEARETSESNLDSD